MSQSFVLLPLTFKATSAVTAKRAVGFNGAQATVKGQKVLGVSPRDVTNGDYSDVSVAGTEVIEAGGNFNAGDSLIVDNLGRAIAATGKLAIAAGATAVTSSAANGNAILSGSDLPEYVFADALENSGGAGDFVEVLLRR
jgi:hypothetical protein